MRIVSFAGEDTAKFVPEIDEISENSLRIFAQKVIDGLIEVGGPSAQLISEHIFSTSKF